MGPSEKLMRHLRMRRVADSVRRFYWLVVAITVAVDYRRRCT
jgi:hypothetical protein